MDATINKQNGDLTAYGFACGYIQKKSIEIPMGRPFNCDGKGRIDIRLYKDGCYFVQICQYKKVAKHLGICGIETDEDLVDGHTYTTDSLKDARIKYANFIKYWSLFAR